MTSIRECEDIAPRICQSSGLCSNDSLACIPIRIFQGEVCFYVVHLLER
jgi:hypothetical protein